MRALFFSRHTPNYVVDRTATIVKRALLQALCVAAVVCTIPAQAAPVVSITAPANNAKLAPLSDIKITANASDSADTIAKVEFFNGPTLLGTA